jgi:hypothetical protein
VTRLDIACNVLARLGKYRAIEAGKQQSPPIENPLGEGYIGVDQVGKKYRARIGVCTALEGDNRRISLGRYDDADSAAFAYRIAHVALYGSYSWVCDSLTEGELYLIESTKRSVERS